MYDVDDTLEVWRQHFSQLCIPKYSEKFDDAHYKRVTRAVREWSNLDDGNDFLGEPFSRKEVEYAVGKLHLKKAPGHDCITAEHIRYGGSALRNVLCHLYNLCVRAECIHSNFRKGIQIPLYKGKNTCPLNPDNYRGITLLSSFNKLFEMLIWHRIERWWRDEGIITELQGACRKGSSCVHTALTLQETISMQREGGRKVFVAYFDVSKAFDSVWIDGLFFQLYELGIKGSLWRMLYKSYKDFTCKVRIGSRTSESYPMLCGIHQGGFLSLLKYILFINSLLVQLKQSNLCCTVAEIQTTPQGYADDLATCTSTGGRMKQVLNIVEKHGNTWRYTFNAKKSSIMVYGETPAETKVGREHRMFSLGGQRVKESNYYDHVGIKACLIGDTHFRTEEKAKKARKVLNMASCLGMKRGGLNMSTCSMIYWTVVVPTLCFGCEIWILKQKDLDILNDFQNYAAKRIQRLHPRSRNITCRACLGWLHIVKLIKVKKMMFCRTIFVMRGRSPIRDVFITKMKDLEQQVMPIPNQYDSPVTDMLNISFELGIMRHIVDFTNGNIMSKNKWRGIVWESAWRQEVSEWQEGVDNSQALSILSKVVEGPAYSIWWQLSDKSPMLVGKCEIMVKLLCKCSLLKGDDIRLRRGTIASRMCIQCEMACPEDTMHMVMQCPSHDELRRNMWEEIDTLNYDIDQAEYFPTVMGKFLPEIDFDDMCRLWVISCTHIVKMYYNTLNSRLGIG